MARKSVTPARIAIRRSERVAVSVDMLSTGYNCRDLLNVVLMRPIFSPTEYIQIKGRGTRRFTFVVGNTEYEKRHFFVLDFCAVAEFFEEKYDYTAPLKLPIQDRRRVLPGRDEPVSALTSSSRAMLVRLSPTSETSWANGHVAYPSPEPTRRMTATIVTRGAARSRCGKALIASSARRFESSARMVRR